MKKKPTQADVDECMDNAITNGYEDEAYDDPNAVACDLIDCTSQFEDCEPDDVAPMVKDWQDRHPWTQVQLIVEPV